MKLYAIAAALLITAFAVTALLLTPGCATDPATFEANFNTVMDRSAEIAELVAQREMAKLQAWALELQIEKLELENQAARNEIEDATFQRRLDAITEAIADVQAEIERAKPPKSPEPGPSPVADGTVEGNE